jgi:hypothetical protein
VRRGQATSAGGYAGNSTLDAPSMWTRST